LIKKYIIAAYSIITAICIIGDVSAAPLKRTQSSIVIDATTGKVISSSNADEKRYPASLTKLMTLYIAFDALDKGKLKLSDNLKVSRRAANQVPSKIGVVAGSTIKAKDVINALIVKSANDCAVVLAEHLGKTEENFAKIMTKTAKELGMKHTTFKNASGLHHSQQKTTARDMVILGSAIYHHFPEYYDLFSTKKFTYNGKTYKTHNHLLKNYTGADGMKTGYTYLAGYNIVTSAQRNNNRVIAVTMGHNSIKNRDYKVAQLMNTGFSKLNNSYQYRAIANLDITQTTSDLLTSDNQNNLWGIQVGAFSNYAKARSYALGIQNQLKPDYASKTSVHVEPFSKGYTVVYRSQLIGLKKNEADKSCNQLKHKNKSCMVVSIEQKTQFAMANQ
jgi:D-alanyl-D-alanine carboxypeptidase